MAAMAVSAVCAATIGFTYGGAPLATLAVALVLFLPKAVIVSVWTMIKTMQRIP